jgi:DNA-binding response OmpR family regulator
MVSAVDILNAPILVVDDKEANVLLIEGMLRIAGYTSVHSTTDSHQVCELHRKNRYGLILLDLQMPIMDGFEVMEELKEIEAGGYLPVLVITAQPDHKLRALEAGAKDFVSKPFDLAELRARVHNILEVRLLHLEMKETVRELEATREIVRLKTLEERKKMEQELALAQETQEACSHVSCRSSRISGSMRSTIPPAMWAAISTISCNSVPENGWGFWPTSPAKECPRRY